LARATLSTLLETGLPRQKHHPFEAQTLILSCFSVIEVSAAAGMPGEALREDWSRRQYVCVRLRLSSERSKRAAKLIVWEFS
jgi:hypothetical protein